jgi:hypothetical protein
MNSGRLCPHYNIGLEPPKVARAEGLPAIIELMSSVV